MLIAESKQNFSPNSFSCDHTMDEPKVSFTETWQIVQTSDGPRNYGKNHYGFIESMSEEIRLSQCSAGTKVFTTDFEDHQNELMHLLFSKFNKTVFNNRLEHRIVFNRRLTSCYGQCDRFEDSGRRTAIVEISPLKNDQPWHLCDTVIHEMCHADAWVTYGYSGRHGPEWQFLCEKAMRIYRNLPFIGVTGP
jgi:SprT-like family